VLEGKRTNVFVFGAGASHDAGADLSVPLTGEILRNARDLYGPNYDDADFRRSFEAIRPFSDILNEPGIVARPKSSCSDGRHTEDNKLEQLVARINEQGDDELERALWYVLYTTLSDLSVPNRRRYYRNEQGELIMEPETNYDQLVKLLPNDELNAFISFNYDLLLDHAVHHRDSRVGNYHLPFAYQCQFEGYQEVIDGNTDPADLDILKPHGSFNWGHCSSCGIYVLFSYLDPRGLASQKCRNCHRGLTPVLVSPVQGTQIPPDITPVWDRAAHLLANADRLIVVGYSFPQADARALTLFRSSLANNGALQSVVIADPCPNEIQCRLEELAGETIQRATTRRFRGFTEFVRALTMCRGEAADALN
jgi:NAD-dependent SIR2 family protein deacetylase